MPFYQFCFGKASLYPALTQARFRRFMVLMRFQILILSCLLAIVSGCATAPGQKTLSRIAFGSCINTNTHPMLDAAASLDFDLFLLIGDNIYADTTNMTVMRRKYDALKQSPFFQTIRAKAPVLATWDDHDFGWNDAGADYKMKREAQVEFLRFMDVPTTLHLWKQEGIYDAQIFGPPGKRVQIILLDTRYFRSNLSTGQNNAVPSGGRYVPNNDPSATMLGEAQWRWLEGELRRPAEVRIIASSIQFISEFSGGEAWANLPREKQRFLDLLEKTKANGVLFISGDRHWAELSELPRPGNYPLYDLTSSALTQKHARGTPTPNKYRAPGTGTYHDANVGMIEIDWSNQTPAVTFKLLDVTKTPRIQKTLPPLK